MSTNLNSHCCIGLPNIRNMFDLNLMTFP